MPIERLSPEDRFMLWPDQRWPQVNGAFLLLHSDGAFRIESLRAAIASHIHAVPRFRQLLQIPPRRLGGPLWIDAERFDIAQHVRERAVQAPAGEPEILAAVEELWCLPLERSRPLWEMWLLTGLSDGRFGVFIKVHHAIADGVATIATLARFLDLSVDVTDEEAQPWTPTPPPTDRELLVDSIRERAHRLRRAGSSVVHPVKTARAVRAAWPALQEILADKPLPPTSLDAVVGSGHNLAPVKTSLALIKDIARANDAKVNDIFLELITGGLRQLFKARGELRPDLIVRISVPVSLRLSERAEAQGNLISAMVVPLPVGRADPVERLRMIAAETARRKTLSRPSMGVFPTNRLLGPLILKAIRRQRVNVASTNVPGPSQHLYLAGAQILEVTPLLPLIGNEPLAVGAMSYAGQFNIMAVGDRQLLPDLGEFAAGMSAELATLKHTSSPHRQIRMATTLGHGGTRMKVADTELGPGLMKIRDVSLYVEVVGNGRPLVLMHGGPGSDYHTMLPLRKLKDEFTLVFYDQRCNGQSIGAPVSTMTWENLTADADALRKLLGFDKWAMLGHSFGGHVALEYALRYPSSLSHLVLLDTGGDSRWARENAAQVALQRGFPPEKVELVRRWFHGESDPRKMFSDLMSLGALYEPHTSLRSFMHQLGGGEWRAFLHLSPEALIFAGRTLLNGWSVMDRLAEIEVPTLVMAGRDDFIFPPEATRELASRIPNATLRIIDGAGHNPQSEQPAAVMDAVRQFLSEDS